MSDLHPGVHSGADAAAVYALSPGHRMQWEEAQQCWVVLYPEGMVRLNDSAAEILRRCDGTAPLSAVIEDLEHSFAAEGLTGDVLDMVSAALGQGWLRAKTRPAG